MAPHCDKPHQGEHVAWMNVLPGQHAPALPRTLMLAALRERCTCPMHNARRTVRLSLRAEALTVDGRCTEMNATKTHLRLDHRFDSR
jgi:hypothetical protein